MTFRALCVSVVALSFGSACGPSSDRESADVAAPGSSHVVSVDFRDSRLLVRDMITAGWTTLRSRESGRSGGHNLVAFRLDDGISVESFLAALDTAKGPPLGALAMGGPEEAELAVTMHLVPGRIVLACMLRDAQGGRHATHGESQLVHVVAPVAPADTGRAPTPTLTISMTDFAYGGPDTWPAGEHTISVSNDGAADHLVTLTRLAPGETLQHLMRDDGSDVGEYLGGIARMGPGRSATMRLNLTPGDYVLACLVTDPRTGKQHVELGMVKLVHVVADTVRARE